MNRKLLPLLLAATVAATVCAAGCKDKIKEVSAKDATCTEAGNIACYTDGKKYYRDKDGKEELSAEEYEVPALGHDYAATFGWASDYSSATVALVCSRNQEHTADGTATVTSEVTEATCVDGKTEYTATAVIEGKTYTDKKTATITATAQHTLGAAYSTDGTNHWKVCSVCENDIGKEAHTFEWKVDTAATETTAGERHEECSVCKLKRNEHTTIPATGTRNITPVDAQAATCATAGHKAYYTDGTNKYADAAGLTQITETEYQNNYVIPATGNHNLSANFTAENSDGDRHWKTCSTCTGKFEEEDHDWQEKIDQPASETQTGLKHDGCTVCHRTKNLNTVIPSTGNVKVITPVSAVAATCKNPGRGAYYTDGVKNYSDVNGEHEIADLTTLDTPALNHDYSAAPEFKWTGYTSAVAEFTCRRAGCDAPNEKHTVNATITETARTDATCGADGSVTHTASVTYKDTPYSEEKVETLTATGNHGNRVSVYVPDDNPAQNGKFYSECEVCHGERIEVGVWGDRKVKVNGTHYNSPYKCYTSENIDKGVTYDAISQLFVISISGTAQDTALTIEGDNNDVLINVTENVTLSSITFTGSNVKLYIAGEDDLTLSGGLTSEAQSTIIDGNVMFNGGVTTYTHLLVIRSGNITVNGTINETAENITVGTADGSTNPTLTVNSTANNAGMASGGFRAFNLQFLSGTTTINQTGSGNVGISCNNPGDVIIVGEHATLNISNFARGIAAWNAAANNATLYNEYDNVHVTGNSEGAITDMKTGTQQPD